MRNAGSTKTSQEREWEKSQELWITQGREKIGAASESKGEFVFLWMIPTMGQVKSMIDLDACIFPVHEAFI